MAGLAAEGNAASTKGGAHSAAIAVASRSAGENAETAQLIRLGLKELAK